MTAPTRDHDIVLFGATGYTGRLVALALAADPATEGLRVALAGRNLDRLRAIRAQLSVERPAWTDMPLLEADTDDLPSLRALAASTRVVCTTVGPYARFGSGLVQACVEAGTDCCDLTGETPWIRRMIDTHHARAQQAGTRIVHCCGFDSIPSDLGVLALQQAAVDAGQPPFDRILYVLRRASGGFSGGTAQSLVGVLREAGSDPSVRRVLGHPYGLNPPDDCQGADGSDVWTPRFEPALGGWLGPFLMAPINTRIVRRSHALLGRPWGMGFQYDEAVWTGRGPAGWAKAAGMAAGMGAFVAVMQIPPVRDLVAQRVLPGPGQGPSAESRERGHFEVQLLGSRRDGSRGQATFAMNHDPGYGGTAILLAAAAVELATGPVGEAGVVTPASAMGLPLIERLRSRGVRLETDVERQD
jgi:short subunit dehydrogenase-like uncharacterized protein